MHRMRLVNQLTLQAVPASHIHVDHKPMCEGAAMAQRRTNWTAGLAPIPAGDRRHGKKAKLAPVVRAALALIALFGVLVAIPSHATPGNVIRSELASAAADLRDLPWGASANRVRITLARNFRGQRLSIDVSGFPVNVTVTISELGRDACLDARRFARRIEGPVVVVLDGYGETAACGEANDMTWRLLP
jgi:hypothetical protein